MTAAKVKFKSRPAGREGKHRCQLSAVSVVRQRNPTGCSLKHASGTA